MLNDNKDSTQSTALIVQRTEHEQVAHDRKILLRLQVVSLLRRL